VGVRSCNNCCAMGRRLAEATKARRTRRTRGEMALRFFRVLVEAAALPFPGARLAGGLLAVVLLAGVLLAGVLPDGAGDCDWATAG